MKKINIKEMIKNEDIVELSSLAEIIKPRRSRYKIKANVFFVKDIKYPYDSENVSKGFITDVILEKNDIIIKNRNIDKIYYFNEKPVDELFAGASDIVIRPHNNEMGAFICLYLISEIGKEVMRSFFDDSVITKPSFRDMMSYPIIKPTEDLNYYHEHFKLKNYKVSNIQEFHQVIHRRIIVNKQNRIEDALISELKNDRLRDKTKKLHEFVTNDYDELRKCYNVKAYKAAIIICGSILEAVLIDWLSDLKGINYFEEPLKPVPTYDLNDVRDKASLSDYINEIKEIKRPRWKTEAEYSHKIRAKRNLVHAKLCIDEENINEKVCLEIIDYLKYIMKQRKLDMKK